MATQGTVGQENIVPPWDPNPGPAYDPVGAGVPYPNSWTMPEYRIKPIAGKDQAFAANRFDAAIGTGRTDTCDVFPIIKQHARAALANDVDALCLAGTTQRVNQLSAGARWQTVHAPRRMARVVKIVHDRKRQTMGFIKPVNHLCCAASQKIDQGLIILAMRLDLDVTRKLLGAIVNSS